MSGLRVVLSDLPIPPAGDIACTLDTRRGVFGYAREAKEPRKLRAVGGPNWLALADHQSRLYRFDFGGKAWRFDPALRVLPDAALGYVQIVPAETAAPVFSASYGPTDAGLVMFHWVTGAKVRWYTEGPRVVVWHQPGIHLVDVNRAGDVSIIR